MEYVAQTSRHVPEWLGGVYVNGHIYGGLKIPDLDSLLVGFGPGTQVIGWDSVPAGGPPAGGVADPPVLRRHGRAGVPCCCWPGCGPPVSGGGGAGCRRAAVLVGRRGQRGGRDRGHGVRLGGHRGRPPAVGRLPAADHHGRRHHQRRRARQPDHRHRPVRGARRGDDRDLADAGPALAPRRRPMRRALRAAPTRGARAGRGGDGSRRRRRHPARRRSPCTPCSAGPTSAAACGTCWPAATARGRSRGR